MIDGTAMYHDAIRRIQELEKLNALLAEHVDRQAKVIDATIAWLNTRSDDGDLLDAVDEYEREMAELAGGR